MRTLNETEMRVAAGGIAPIPQIPPAPTCEPPQTTQEMWEIRMWWQDRRTDEELRNRANR